MTLVGREREIAADQSTQRVARSRRLRDEPRRVLGHARRQPQRQRVHERVPIADTTIEDRLAHAGLDRDRIERCVGPALADEALGRRKQRLAVGDDAVVAGPTRGPARPRGLARCVRGDVRVRSIGLIYHK